MVKSTKKTEKITAKETTAKKKPVSKKNIRYYETVGRRKCSTARIRIFEGHKDKGKIIINEKDFSVYFPLEELRKLIEAPFYKTKTKKSFYTTIKVCGGGIKSQAEAIRHGISRALLKVDPDHRQILKIEGYLTRDARVKERRKFGLKKARKAPQWSKR